MEKLHKVLRNETASQIETLHYLLAGIMGKYGVRINLNDIAGISKMNSQMDDLFNLYNYHNNSFCNTVKRNQCMLPLCVKAKNATISACARQSKPFYGKCYLGIGEFYYPVWFAEQLVALICIGQFSDRSAKSLAFVRDEAEKHGLEPAAYEAEYLNVTKEIDFSVSDLNRDLWAVCNYMSLFYHNGILQQALKAELPEALSSSKDYYQNKAIISAALDFLKTNYASSISLDLLANHCYCNPTYLSHLFKKELGVTITDYLNNHRVERAKHLLDITDLNITQISQAVGFNDASYFSKVFAKIQGDNPTAYRTRTKNNPSQTKDN